VLLIAATKYKTVFKKGIRLFFLIIVLYWQPCYSQVTGSSSNKHFKDKLFLKAGLAGDYDLYPHWGHQYSFGYGRNIWKGLSVNLFYTHCQTNTLSGSLKYDSNPYGSIADRSYINKYIGISVGDYYGGIGTNGLNVHDVFCVKASYDFKLGKHISIIPFFGVAYGWSKVSKIYIDSANFINNKLVGGSTGFSYEQGKVFGPDMGFDIGYSFKNKHHQLFFEPELILLTTPGYVTIVSAYEAVQLSLGYNYRF
jgi:hypothetical protein